MEIEDEIKEMNIVNSYERNRMQNQMLSLKHSQKSLQNSLNNDANNHETRDTDNITIKNSLTTGLFRFPKGNNALTSTNQGKFQKYKNLLIESDTNFTRDYRMNSGKCLNFNDFV